MALKDLVLWNRKNNAIEKRDSLSPFDSFHREVNRMFDEVFGDFGSFPSTFFGKDRFSSFSPSINVSEGEKSIEVSAELPGMEEKDIEVVLKNRVLTIKGEKKSEEKKEEKEFYKVERSFGSFQRSIQIPDEIEVDKIKASFKNGVLQVTLPKSESAQKKVRRIEVKAA
ncbi:Hsp20/alpha crystallin family protein [bacterium]|nr:Hsp20/alpha crystallin family protein [bacterium]